MMSPVPGICGFDSVAKAKGEFYYATKAESRLVETLM